MDKKCTVLFLDSGLGGISYCRHFHQRNPGVPIVYLADRLHFPYGKRKKEELIEIITGLAERLVRDCNPAIIVLACNTASLAALSHLRERFPALPFVGTVPAVKPAALASKTGKIGVLATELTVTESYIRELAAKHGDNEVIGIAAPELVEFVECRLVSASPQEKEKMARGYIDRFRAAGADVLVLGCTHFLFLHDEFRREAAPDITVFESTEGISQRIESLLEQGPGAQVRGAQMRGVQNRLLLTGDAEPEPSWTLWADHLGFELSLLDTNI